MCVCVCFAGSQHISPRPRDYFERIYLDGRFPSTAYVTTCRVPARNKTERRKTSDRQRAQETRENGGGRAGVGREMYRDGGGNVCSLNDDWPRVVHK